MTRTHWTLAETLRKYSKKPPALARASSLSKNTVYDIVNGKTKAVTLETLDKLLSGLEEITGAPMTVRDVLRREQQADINPDLLAQVANIKPLDVKELLALVPDWTDEERAENDRFWDEYAAEKAERRARAIVGQEERERRLMEAMESKSA